MLHRLDILLDLLTLQDLQKVVVDKLEGMLVKMVMDEEMMVGKLGMLLLVLLAMALYMLLLLLDLLLVFLVQGHQLNEQDRLQNNTLNRLAGSTAASSTG
jgi:hypothetical protein